MKWIFIALLIGAVLALVTTLKGGSRKASNEKPRRKAILSKREQPMYWRLKEALPEHEVLCQVSFSALLTAKAYGVRATFNRKYADFIVVNRSFNVLAVIELDDSTHRGNEARDADRDSMLTGAGYKVIRYESVPSASTIRADVTDTHQQEA